MRTEAGWPRVPVTPISPPGWAHRCSRKADNKHKKATVAVAHKNAEPLPRHVHRRAYRELTPQFSNANG